MKYIQILALSITVMFIQANQLVAQPTEPDKMVDELSVSLHQLVTLHKEVKSLNPALEKLYPIAILDSGFFYLFDYDSLSDKYKYQFAHQATMQYSEKITASFPLDFYGMRPACIASKDVFHEIDGFKAIFHEFVHCYQWGEGKIGLKETLGINKEAKEENDFMWEINFKMPYDHFQFTQPFSKYLYSLEEETFKEVVYARKKLNEALSKQEWEYFIWQEWKEGFARYIENKVAENFHFEINQQGRRKPYNRTSFYYSGDLYIQKLAAFDPEITHDLEGLFNMIRSPLNPLE